MDSRETFYRDEALRQINQCHTGDTEADHEGADDALCEFLEALGHFDVVEAWRSVEKWYA